MPYKDRTPKECLTCGAKISRKSTHCQKHVPRTDEWRKKIGEANKKRQFFPNIRKGEEHHNWKGGKVKTSGGYVYIFSPEHPNKSSSNYVMEHRLVMESVIGRYLEKKEHVHHINHIRHDNRIENLQLMTASEHARMHIKETRESGKINVPKSHCKHGHKFEGDNIYYVKNGTIRACRECSRIQARKYIKHGRPKNSKTE